MSFSYKRPEDSPGFLLWQLTHEWQRKQRQALTALKLTHPQFVVLASLLWFSLHSDNVVTQNDIVEFAKIDKMMMSDLTATLVKKRFIHRIQHPRDKRAYALTLTASGKKLVQKAIPIVEGIDAEFFSRDTVGLVHLNRVLNEVLKDTV